MWRWTWSATAILGTAVACSSPVGELRLVASGGNEGTRGIAPSATADGWAVRFDHAVLSVVNVRALDTDGNDAGLEADPVVIDLVQGSSPVYSFSGVPAGRWESFSYHVAPVPVGARQVAVDPALVERMREAGYSTYYAGVFVAPPGTVDADGRPVGEVPFELGFPVEVDYTRCVSGTDRRSGVVVPLNSASTYELTWHLTHLFFDSYAEDSALRVEPLAARWTGADPVRIDDLDVSLGSLRGMNGRALRDSFNNPVVYVPGMSGATTLREFVLMGRPGHFNGLEGFCATRLRILE